MSNLPAWLSIGSLALLVPFWQQAKTLFNNLRSVLIVRISVEGYAEYAIINMLEKEYQSAASGDKRYRSETMYVKPVKRQLLVAWEFPRNKVYWRGFRPLFLTTENSKNGDSSLIITTFRGIDLDALLLEAITKYNATVNDEKRTKHSRFAVHNISGRLNAKNHGRDDSADSAIASPRDSRAFEHLNIDALGWKHEDIGEPINEKGAFAGLSFPPQVLEALKEFDYWLQSKEWFEQHEVPWRRGWLLSGPPGSGKSRLARALGQYGNMPIYSYDLSTLTNQEFQYEWSRMMSQAPCIALMEDFDAVFQGRENVSNKDEGLTFDCLLNTISGVSQANGVFLLITTNHIETLDPAIGVPKNGVSTRPGRIDRIITIADLPAECRREIASRILDEWPDHIERVVAESEGYTGAQVTDMCVQLAAKLFWEQKVDEQPN